MQQFLSKILPPSCVPYLLHTRPKSWLIVSAHMSIGYLLAGGLQFTREFFLHWLTAVVAWGILGNGGTLALNSAYDQDEGDIGYLDNPPPAPRHLAAFAIIFMLLAVPLALTLSLQFMIACLICFFLSILYSVPPFRFKARAGLDVLINSTGYGALTIYAGWAAASRPLEAPILNVALAFFFFFTGFYPLTQIYQMKEDLAHGDRTFALALGKRNALLFACLGIGIGFAFLTIEIINQNLPLRSAGIALALLAWAFVLIPWYNRHEFVGRAYEKRGFYQALYAWAFTDIAVAVALMPL